MNTPAPLAGRRVLVTRAQESSAALVVRLQALGAIVAEAPLLRFDPPESYAPLDAALARLQQYDMLLVTSANTARVLAGRRPTPWHDQPWTAAIGPATANALRALHLSVDLVPAQAVGEALLDALRPHASGRRILLPRAEVARDTLPEGLREAGATVHVVVAYRTAPAWQSRQTVAELFQPSAPRIEFVIFTSGSTVDNFFLILGERRGSEILEAAEALAIGPVTAACLRAHGVGRIHTARQHDLSGLVDGLKELASTSP